MKVIRSYILPAIIVVSVLLIAEFFQRRRNSQYNNDGIKTNGIVTKCKKRLTRGECDVTVEYINAGGTKIQFTDVLYDKDFCQLGKTVPVIYLPNGDAKVDEHVGFFGGEDENGNLK